MTTITLQLTKRRSLVVKIKGDNIDFQLKKTGRRRKAR